MNCCLVKFNRRVVVGACALIGCLAFSVSASAQFRDRSHRLVSVDTIPGTVAFQALVSHPDWVAHMQPIKIIAPDGAVVSVWDQGIFQPVDYANPTVGMGIGPVFRFRLSRVPRMLDREFFPSIEVINRLYPPDGLAIRFPVNVVITEDDLNQVAQGNLVTKIIYLENPETALPYRQLAGDQQFFDVQDIEDPLRAAEKLGRAMAILRIGTRVPAANEFDEGFYFQGWPAVVFPQEVSVNLDQRMKQASDKQLQEGVISVGHTVEPRDGDRLGVADNDTGPSRDSNTSTFVDRDVTDPALLSGQGFPQTIGTDGCWPTGPMPGFRFSQPLARDEFVLDGGDRDLKAVVDQNWKVHGLETEDTIGHFDTLDGRRLVVASNRVAIYSPRFAAVRKLTNLTATTSNARLSSFREQAGANQTKGMDFSSTTLQQLQPQRHQVTARASSFLDQTRGVNSDSVISLRGSVANFAAFENIELIRIGKHQDSQSTRLQLGMASAQVWQHDLGLYVALNNMQPVIVNDVARVQEIVSVKAEGGEAKLQIVKIASKIAAQPGEEVDFTLRFDNVGVQSIGNVTIIDNLTNRLEYVADSAQCTLDAKFTTERNEGESLTLRWELTEPLAKGQGGIIRFKCRLR